VTPDYRTSGTGELASRAGVGIFSSAIFALTFIVVVAIVWGLRHSIDIPQLFPFWK
jgi:hypothetical protein